LLRSDEGELKKMEEAGRSKVEREYNSSKNADKLLRIFDLVRLQG
jgi:hypothetical protein